jgi:F-type H+-transporting ATPase subunit b
MDEFLNSNLASFIWGLAAFVVFVLILLKLAVKHVLAAVDAREARIARELAESEAAYVKAKQTEVELAKQMKGAEAKIAELIAEAKRDAEALKARTIESSRGEIEAIRTRSLREIEAARHAAIVQLKQAVAEVAIQVAEKIVREKLDAGAQQQVVGSALEAYEARLAKVH